jgi:hypothetical protein
MGSTTWTWALQLNPPIRSRPESAPPAAGELLRSSLLAGGAAAIVLALAGLLTGMFGPSHALAVGLAAFSLIFLGVGFACSSRC